MSHELLYTSAPHGLKPGSRGFCTVLSTQGMPAPLATAVESLSGYRPIYPSSDERSARNPIVYSHLKMQAAGRLWHVLSRIADYGLDYSQRPNKLAHHVILDSTAEKLPGGPANLIAMPRFMRDEWEGEPKLVAVKPITREPRSPSGICEHWHEMTGDAGWAGVVAESFLSDPERQVILLFEPGQEVLPLFLEAISLLPPEKRWDVTFSTYFTGLATGTTCNWRAIISDSKEARDSLRFVSALRIDLTRDSLGQADGGALVDSARTGNPDPRNDDDSTRLHLLETGGDASDLRPTGVDEFANHESKQPPSAHRNPRQPPQLVAPSFKSHSHVPSLPPRRNRLDSSENASGQNSRKHRTALMVGGLGLLFLGMAGFVLRNRSTTFTNQSSANAIAKSDNSEPREKPTTPARLLPEPGSTQTEKSGLTTEGDASKANPPSDNKGDDKAKVETAGAETTDAPQPKHEPTMKCEFKRIPKKNESAVVLERFPVSQSQPPRLHLFCPEWLTYVEDKPTKTHEEQNNAKRAVSIPLPGLREPIALFTLIKDNESYSYRLKTLNYGHSQMLGWYRIQLTSPMPAFPILKEIKFIDFPIDSGQIDKTFENKPIRWHLPVEAVANAAQLPKLIFDRLIVSIADNYATVQAQESAAESKWSFECETLLQILGDFPQNGDNNKHKLAINVEIKPDTKRLDSHCVVIELQIVNQDYRLNSFKNGLSQKMSNCKSAVVQLCKSVDDLLQSKSGETYQVKVRKQGDGISIESVNSVEAAEAVCSSLKEMRIELQKKSAASGAAEVSADFKSTVSKVTEQEANFKEIGEAVVKYRKVVDGLMGIRIVSARIHYWLVNKADISKRIDVDVVRFDDRNGADLNASESSSTNRGNP